MDEVQLTTQYALVKDPRRMPRLINHPDRNPPSHRAGRTYAVVGTVERGGKVDVVEERRARCRVAAPVAGWVSAKVLAPHATDQVAAAVTVTTASTGVVALRDMPALLREANEGSSLEAREVDFVLDVAQSSITGVLDDQSTVAREDVLRALQGVAMRFADDAQRRLAIEDAQRR